MKQWKLILLMVSMVYGIIVSSYAFGAEALKIYSTSKVTTHEMIAELCKQETGLDLTFLNMPSGIIWTRILAEAKSGRILADIVISTHDCHLDLKKKGLLLPYKSKIWDSSNVPEIFKDPEGYWYGWAYWTGVIIVNTDLLKKMGKAAPRSWNDLIDPKWKHEIVMPNPATSGTAYMMLSTIFQIMGEEKGWDYLAKLHKNVDQYTKSGSGPADLVARGEYAIGFTWDIPPFTKKAAGYPVDVVTPEPGTGFQLDTVSILRDTDKLEDAKRFIDFLGTRKFMELAAKVRSKVTMPGVKAKVDFEPKLINYDAAWSSANKKRIMKTWKDKFTK